MEIPVLIEPVAGNGYRASSAAPLPYTVEGNSREEALRKLRGLIESKLRSGAELTQLTIQTEENPWLSTVGIWDPQDPLVQEWKQIMAEKRQQDDQVQEAS